MFIIKKTLINLIILVLSLTGCVRAIGIGQTDLNLESRLKSDFNKDMQILGRYVNYGSIRFYFFEKGIREEISGHCSQGFLDKAVSVKTSEFYGLMYLNFVHELGHCLFEMGHDNDKIGIMNSIFSQQVLFDFKFEIPEKKITYIKQMFE